MLKRRLLVAVTVSTADGVRGLLLQGRRKSTGVVVGRFVDVESPGATTVHCERPDDTLVAWYADGGVDGRSFSWMPPDDAADGPPLQLVYVEPSSSSSSSSLLHFA